MSKEQAISELEAVINKVWSRTKTTSPLLEAIYKWHEEESNKAVIDKLSTFLTYEENQPGYVDWDFLASQIQGLKEQIGEE